MHTVFLKLLFLIIVPLTAAIGIARGISQYIGPSPAQPKNSEVLLAFPMKDKQWKDIGVVAEPVVTFAINTPRGRKNNKFLLDSGAVISSLPREWADELGLDLAFLPRSTFGGFGGKTSVAYQGEMMVLLGEEEVLLPVVFTEAAGTKALLGRKGFFNRYSIVFDHIKKQIEIKK